MRANLLIGTTSLLLCVSSLPGCDSPAPSVDAATIDAPADACDVHLDNEDCSGDVSAPACCAGAECVNYWCSDGTIYSATYDWSCRGATCGDDIEYACSFTQDGAVTVSTCGNGCATSDELHCGPDYGGADAGSCGPATLCAP